MSIGASVIGGAAIGDSGKFVEPIATGTFHVKAEVKVLLAQDVTDQLDERSSPSAESPTLLLSVDAVAELFRGQGGGGIPVVDPTEWVADASADDVVWVPDDSI